MKKPEIVRKMAQRTGVSPAEAADRLDGMVRRILADLRGGKSPDIPGLGRFREGPGGKVVFEPEEKPHRG